MNVNAEAKQTILRVIDIYRLPQRTSTLASVEVVQGVPIVGAIFTSSESNKKWKIVGFGTAPTGMCISPKQEIDLLFEPLHDNADLIPGLTLQLEGVKS